MRVSVRTSAPADAALLDAHRRAAEEESRGYRGHLDATASTGSAVVEIDGSPVGSVCFSDEGTVRTITRLHVLEAFRQVGAGDALMEWVVSDARSRGMTALRGTALPGDRRSKNLFERHGLVARAIQVERPLD